jgi:hypothetical protein
VENETPDAEAALVEGTLGFSTVRTGELEIQERKAHIRSAGAGRTAAQVSVIGPKELHIYVRPGVALFSHRGESKTIAEGESYEVISDPPEDGPDKSKPRRNQDGRRSHSYWLRDTWEPLLPR